MEQPVEEILITEIDQVGQRHRRQPHLGLATRERVPEPCGSAERRRTGRHDARGREVVGRDLEQFGGVRQAMHLVQHDSLPAIAPEEALGVLEQPAHPGQLAIEILALGERLAEHALPDAANSHEPDDGAMPPRPLDAVDPEAPRDHGISIASG